MHCHIMDEWSSSDLSPGKMWNMLKSSDPQIDEQFYRLPDGRWDVNRLNEGVARLQKQEELRLKQEHENYILMQNQKELARAERTYHKKIQRKEQSKFVDLTVFKVGMHMYLWPVMCQLFLLIVMLILPTSTLISSLPIFLIIIVSLNVIFWVSIPLMTKNLADQILKIDNRTKHLLENQP
ncbi:MAG: hypothetical protein DWC02_01130 [Candidatus Poseidoniales archaeon]|nr:MAG: hypothetical protein DWC02_01130 [Candidatus Poseidoniales archaeon]